MKALEMPLESLKLLRGTSYIGYTPKIDLRGVYSALKREWVVEVDSFPKSCFSLWRKKENYHVEFTHKIKLI